jgi:hypothetical protein
MASSARKKLASLNIPVHFERFQRMKEGETIESIAEADGVTEQVVRRSIATARLYRERNTADQANQAIVSVLLDEVTSLKRTLHDALNAEVVYEKGGKTVKEPDHSTRVNAGRLYKDLAQTVQPKSDNSTKIQVGVGINQGRVATGAYVGMEDRLREIRQKRTQNVLPEAKTVRTMELDGATGEFATPADDGEDDE